MPALGGRGSEVWSTERVLGQTGLTTRVYGWEITKGSARSASASMLGQISKQVSETQTSGRGLPWSALWVALEAHE